MNETGFIVLHRKLLEWKYRQFPCALALWVYLILRANWKPGYFLGIEIPRGSLATSIKALADATGMTSVTVRKWLKVFENDGMITRKSTNRFTIINISKYKDFQDIPEDRVLQQTLQQPLPNRTNKQSNKVTKKQIKDSLGAVSAPDLMEVVEYVRAENLGVNPEKFYRFYHERNWMINGDPIHNWKSLLRNWAQNERKEAEGIKIPMPQYGQPPKKKIDLTTMPGWKEEEE